ncbi:MAG: flagella basal body P-ring formation protein FlgA [Pseudomonadota bacterium]
MLSSKTAYGARWHAALTPLCFTPVAAIMFIPLYSPVFASQNEGQAILPPTQIDQAVETFTGASIGAVGGARAAADPRLRLAACAQPLETSWHGTARAAVKVECNATLGDAGAWRIFIATRPASASAAAPGNGLTAGSKSGPVITRGDTVTVVVRGRGFTVQQSGEAMENGAIGEWIGIRTARRADPIRARIERPGLAIIAVE